jgi:hypothetical protein
MTAIRIVLGLCGVAAAGSATAAGYPAAPPPSGNPVYAGQSLVAADVALALGYFWFNPDRGRDTETGEVWGAARVNLPIAGGWLNEEIEVSGLTGFEKNSYETYGIYSHTYFKSPQAAAGLLLGASSIDGDRALTTGVEAVVFQAVTSFAGLIAYSWGHDGLPDFWSASGEARWYWNENSKLTGSVSFNEFNHAWKFTAGAEHRFPGTMASILGEATYYTNDQGDGWELFAGGRLFLDRRGQTLQGHDYDVPFAAARAITY